MYHNVTNKWLYSFILILSLMLAGCASETAAPVEPTASIVFETPTPEPIVLVDGLGNEITLSGPAQRVVSLAPSNTEILFAIGAGSQVVGRDSFSDYPEEAVNITDIGGGFGELDTETILSLSPDLVLAADIFSPEQIQALTDLGLKVFALPNPLQIEDLFTNLSTVGKLTGRETEAAALVGELTDRLSALDEKLLGVTDKPLVLYELDATDPSAPWLPGPGTFVEGLIQRAGGENLGSAMESAWGQMSIEEILVQDPDFILLGDAKWGGVTPEDVEARVGWGELSAVENDRVFAFDDDLVSRPGPRLVDGLEAMAKLIHPGIFE